MAWLGTWANRKKVTIDNTNIDSDLTHFPVPIVLGTSVGQSDQDVSDIFDELGSDSLKIAITKSDGTTQIYGEIEQWDAANEKALIWVSKSDLTLSASSATELYLYYDAAQPDNIDYIGTVGDTPAQNVWNSGIISRYALSGNETDSITANDGTPTDVTYTTGKLGQGASFNATTSIIDCGDTLDFGLEDTFSVFLWVKFDDVPDSFRWLIGREDSTVPRGWSIRNSNDGINPREKLFFLFRDASDSIGILSSPVLGANFTRIAAVYNASGDASGMSLFLDGALLSTTVFSDQALTSINASVNASIGARVTGGGNIDGVIDDVVVYNDNVSNAWIKADYHAQTDNLITFGVTEVQPLSISDMAMDIKTWQEKTNNVSVDIHAASWTMAAVNLDCHTALQSMSDTIVDITTIGERLKNQKVDISVGSIGIDNVMLSMQLANQLFRNAFLDVFLTDGTIRQDAYMDVAASDGNKKENLGLDMMAVSTSPEFKSVYAMNLSSIIKEITA